jgi:hypothetical protein
MQNITFIGISVIFLYSLIQILKFNGISEEVYNVYIVFYIMLIISKIIIGT